MAQSRSQEGRRYYERNRDRILESQREYRERNRDAIRERKQRYYQDNHAAIRARVRQQYAQDPLRYKAHNLKSWYGITWEQFQELLAAQEGRCAICQTDRPGGRGRCLHVDHCHETGKVRGLICNRCNAAIGQLKTPALLMAAAEYLQRGEDLLG